MKKFSKQDYLILLGNTIDHYDVAIYSFIAPVLASIFFPSKDPIIALIMSYSVLMTSFFVKPIGAYIFTFWIQKKKFIPSKLLSYTLMGVGTTTFLIGLLPIYNDIGFFAPCLLIILRLIRDFFASGESAIAKMFILESKNDKHAFKGSYIYQASSVFGVICASMISTIIYYVNIPNLWRVVFFLGGSASFVGFILRRDSNFNITLNKNLYSKYLGLRVLYQNKLALFRIAFVTSFTHLTYAIPFIVMNSLIPLIIPM